MADVQHRENAQPHDASLGELVLEHLRIQQATLDQLVAALNRIESRLDSTARNGARSLSDTRPPDPAPPPAPSQERAPSPVAPARRRRRRFPGRRPVRSCAVCKRASSPDRKRELLSAGWIIAGRLAVCPSCRDAGWRVGEDGGLPFRPRTLGGR
jgi:hypothetical protein